MILADKISELRRARGWSQEELAERINVTRQSVSKWESGQSTPDLDKILQLSEIFGVSCDYLLKETGTTLSAAGDDDENRTQGRFADSEFCEKVRKVSAEEAAEFMEIKKSTSFKNAFAVFLCIISPVALIGMAGLSEEGLISLSEDKAALLGCAVLLVLVAAAVAIFIYCGMQTKSFDFLEKEPISVDSSTLQKVRAKKQAYESAYRVRIIVGVTMFILSAVSIFAAGLFGEKDYYYILGVCVLLIIVACAMLVIIPAGIVNESYDKLLQEGDYTKGLKKENRELAGFDTAYWVTTTAIFLGYSFITENWERSWIIWPVAALLFVAVRQIIKAIRKK